MKTVSVAEAKPAFGSMPPRRERPSRSPRQDGRWQGYSSGATDQPWQSLADLRARLPPLRGSSADLINEMREPRKDTACAPFSAQQVAFMQYLDAALWSALAVRRPTVHCRSRTRRVDRLGHSPSAFDADRVRYAVARKRARGTIAGGSGAARIRCPNAPSMAHLDVDSGILSTRMHSSRALPPDCAPATRMAIAKNHRANCSHSTAACSRLRCSAFRPAMASGLCLAQPTHSACPPSPSIASTATPSSPTPSRLREHPQLVTIEAIGNHEGRDIWVATLTNAKTGPAADKPAFWLDAISTRPRSSASAANPTFGITCHVRPGCRRHPRARYARVPSVRASIRTARNGRSRTSRSGQPTRPYPHGEEDIEGLTVEDIDGIWPHLQMRIADANGVWKAHPEEPRLMIRREPAETGAARITASFPRARWRATTGLRCG